MRAATTDISSCIVYEANEKRTKDGERGGENSDMKFNVIPYKIRVVPEMVCIGKDLGLQDSLVYRGNTGTVKWERSACG